MRPECPTTPTAWSTQRGDDVTARAVGQPIFFAHVHKSGGSSFCNLAIANGELTDPRFNCKAAHAQHVALATGSVSEQTAALRQLSNISFLAVEHGLSDAWSSSVRAYRLVTVLRSPEVRYISHFAHQQLVMARSGTMRPHWPT